MTPTTRQTRLLILTLALAVLCAGAIATTASAQEVPGMAGNETTTEESTQVVEQLGDLVVHSYDYQDGEMTIEVTWQGGIPETLTATEMIELDSEGATQISFKQVRLRPDDKTTLTVNVEKSDGTAAVMLTTPQSVENSNALVLQDGDGTTRGAVPFGHASALVGGAALAGAGLAFAFTARQHEDDAAAERRDRIA